MYFEKIKEIIADRTDIDPDSITMDTDFLKDLHMDSLDRFQVISDIEDEYGIDIDSPSDIIRVSDAVELVERLVRSEE